MHKNKKSGEVVIVLMILCTIPLFISICWDFKMAKEQRVKELKSQITNDVEVKNETSQRLCK